MTMCKRCGIRWQQGGGLCRTCGHAAGDSRTTRERERDRLAAREAALTRVVEPAPGALRTVCIAGVDYDVTWDGTR